MNIDTGEIIRLVSGQEIPEGFTQVPEDFKDEVNRIFEDQAEENRKFADMAKNTPLTQWAKEEQRKRKKSNRGKMAKASKRRNRRE